MSVKTIHRSPHQTAQVQKLHLWRKEANHPTKMTNRHMHDHAPRFRSWGFLYKKKSSDLQPLKPAKGGVFFLTGSYILSN